MTAPASVMSARNSLELCPALSTSCRTDSALDTAQADRAGGPDNEHPHDVPPYQP